MTNPTPHGQVPEALIDLIDAYAEIRYRCGGIYNARTEAARKAVIEALSEAQALSAAPAIGDELRDTLVAVSAAIAERDDRAAQKMICEILAASTTPPAEQAAPKAVPGEQNDACAILAKVCDLFQIGALARTESTILSNVENTLRFSNMLGAVERDLFPQPDLPEDDDPYAEVDDNLPTPNKWGAEDEADYVSQFKAALLARGFAAPQQEAQEPYAYAVYFPDQPKVELVHELDELTDDLTNRPHAVTKLYTAPQPAPAPLIAKSLAEWHEQDGNVAWWAWNGREWAGEPAWIGTPNCEDWPGYHTHWTPHPEQPVFAAIATQGGK